jgi:RHS repeat-associated protein
MLSATQSGTTVSFTWDALGRQRTQTLPIASIANPVFTSDYDLAGRRTRLTWPVDASGPTAYHVDYDYLVTGEVEKIREKGATSGSGVLATYGYDQLGRRSSIARGNGASTGYQYDDVSRLSQLSHDFAGTTHDLTLDFTYNPASQIVGRTATNSAYAWTGHGSGSTASTADGLNRLAGHGGATPTYDAKGNITFDGTYSYAYSSENLLTSFSTSGTLEYDPLMRFYRNFTTYFIHDGPSGQFIGEYSNGNTAGRYVPGPDTDEALALIDKFGNRTWFHADERGSVIASSGATSANTYVVRFDEYGKRGSGGSWRFAFTGQLHLLGDVYYYKNRHYNARLGRFLQADPIGYAGGMNLYAYVGADPVNFTDPLGLDETIVVTAFGMLGGSGRGDVFGQGGSTGISEAELQRRIEENSRQSLAEELVQEFTITAKIDREARRGSNFVKQVVTYPWRAFVHAIGLGRKPRPPRLLDAPCGCFEAGTEVSTPNGPRPIEDIMIGDLVFAQNERTGEIAAKAVVSLIRPENKALYALSFIGPDGQKGTFSVTDDHPWKVQGKGWVETQHLAPYDHIETASGQDIVVETVHLTERRARTYNLTIADWHTFMVGRNAAIVHNQNCYTHNYKYHRRIRERGVQDPRSHNFPYSYDDEILRQPPTVRWDGARLYRLPGYLGSKPGVFEIGLNPSTGVIFHRMFRGN